jgi:hypothetical protein
LPQMPHRQPSRSRICASETQSQVSARTRTRRAAPRRPWQMLAARPNPERRSRRSAPHLCRRFWCRCSRRGR